LGIVADPWGWGKRFGGASVPDDSEGDPPLLPVLNRYKPIGTTAEVDFKTTRPCYMTQRGHVNQVVAGTMNWEGSAAFRQEQSPAVNWYVWDDHLGLVIPYE
jgi:type III restriction enzyme